MGLKMNNFNIVGVDQFLWEGDHKKPIYKGHWLKRWAWTICRELSKKGRRVFWGGDWHPNVHYDLILLHARTWYRTCWCERIEFGSIFPQFNAKGSSQFEFKRWIPKTASLLIYCYFLVRTIFFKMQCSLSEAYLPFLLLLE